MFLFAILTLMNIAVDTAAAIQVNAEAKEIQIPNDILNIENEHIGINQSLIIEENKAAHQASFTKYINSLSFEKSYVVDREKHDTIIKYLKNTVEEPNAKFKSYVKRSCYNLVDEVLHKDVDGNNLPVAIKEEFFNILYTLHCVQRGHCGINKLWHQLDLRYHGMPRKIVTEFVNLCPICNLKQVQKSQPRIKPIRSEKFLSRLQIDLVDMRHNPCIKNGRTYNWIAHVIDHFTQFHIIWALEHKSAEEVVAGLESRVFAYLGLPLVLQSDNGTEFKNSLMVNLVQSWDGECKIIHGRPRHPQSQGLVEQANGTMQRMIAAMIIQFKKRKETKKLLHIMLAIV